MRIVSLLLCFAVALPLQAATWYVRPATGEYGTEDGTSYETAWDGLGSVVWGEGGVRPGDTLYICDTHEYGTGFAYLDNAVGASGTAGNPITIRGDLAGHPGVIVGARKYPADSFTDLGNGTYRYYTGESKPGGVWQGDPVVTPQLLKGVSWASLADTDGSWWFNGPRDIEALTLSGSDPIAITLTGHGYTTGWRVYLRNVVGITPAFSTSYSAIITVVNENTFTLDGTDSSQYSGSFMSGTADARQLYVNPYDDDDMEDMYQIGFGGVYINGQDYLVIDGLKLFGGAGNDGVLRLCKTAGNDAEHITIRNCEIAFGAYTGVYAAGSAARHITIEDCVIHDVPTGTYTIHTGGLQFSDWTFRRVEVHSGRDTRPCYGTSSADRHALGGQGIRNLLVEYCYIHDWAGDGILDYVGASNNIDNVTIRYNRIHNLNDDVGQNHHYGIARHGTNDEGWSTRAANWYIYGNVISNLGTGAAGDISGDGAAFRLKGPGGTSDQWPKIYNNTIYDCRIGLFWVGFAQETGGGFDFRNNICLLPKAGGYHVYMAPATGAKTLSMDNNCWYPDTSGGNNQFRWYGSTASNWANFKTKAAVDGIAVESMVADPMLVDPAAGKMWLQTGSACIDVGNALASDYRLILRSASGWPDRVLTQEQSLLGDGWEIGAYVYEQSHTHVLSVAGSNGSVSRSPEQNSYMDGEVVDLIATPNAGYRFVNWLGDLSGSSNPATLVMDSSKSVTAVFASNVHTLTVAASGGTVTKSPDKGSYEYGESVTLTASADAGYSFSGWSGAASGTNSSVTITMDGDKSITANFAAISYTLSIAATNGSVAASPQKAGYSYNESVSLQAVPGTGYHFTGWSGSLSGSTNPASIVMTADKSVTAAFAVNTYTLTTSATNGSVVKSPQAATYTHGATVSLQAVAAEGYEFAGWSGAVSGSANPVEIVMDSSKSVTAAFTVKTYTLTTSATNGSVVRSPDSATYAHGATVSLQAVAAEGYEFAGWSGAVSGSSNPVSLVMDASKSVTAAFAANAYTLSISAANGAVTASPSQATYTHGQVVTLTAAPSSGYGFSSWSGDASGTAASTTVTMDGNKSVTAAFTLNTYTLSITSANGTVTRDPVQATYTHGQTVTLTAVPATGYSFSSWSGDLSGTVASATITMDGNKSVAAGFTINSYTLNTSGANGSITKNPDKSTYNHGETVTLQAVPAEGYNFVNWSGDLTGSANPATLVMDSNKTVAAAFATNTYTLQTNATNGSVTRTPDQASFTFGQTITLTAVPQTGYSFSGWSGDASGSTATVTITMNADKSVIAGFTANAYTLSVSASNGSVTVNPIRATYAHGEVVTLTAVPSVGYSFGSWSGDAFGTATSTTVTMDSNKSVTAAFALNTYTLSITSANGTVTKNPSQATYNHGDTVALTAAPAEGYRFAGWSGDLTGSSNPATLTMTSNKSVTAHFTAVSNDNEAPVLFGFSPLADAIQVPLNSLVLLRITDSGDGVDANTVTIRVNDNVVYAGNVASVSGDHGVCRRVGTPAHYVYAFQPVEDFDYDSTVAVTVNAADLAGNAMAQQSYSFRTQMRTFGSNHCASWGPDGLDKGGAATVCDAGGNVWVVWHAGDAGSRDIYLSRLTSGQEQFSGPIQLTSNASDQCNPDIAIGPDGRLFVVWQDNRRGNWDIYLRTSADGVTWSSEAEATDFTNDETNPVIAVDARSPSYAYIAWQDNRAGNQDIYVASSSTHFASKTVACVTSNVQDQIGPRIAVDGANGVYLVWTDFRNGAADVYGAASSSGPWTNVAVATGVGSQSAPDIAAEPGGYSLHFVWVNRVDNQDDVFYGTSVGLPASPLAGMNIIDDTSSADQRTPAIMAAGSGGTARVFAAWQDFRNAADGLDTDLYAAEIKAGSVTNLFVGDGWTRTNQAEPCIGVDLFGRPYVVWTDERNAKDEIYFAASTFVEPTPLDVRMVVGATGGTVGVASPTQLDDVSVVIPAGACAYDVTVSIARIWNLEPDLPADILPYEFGPSGLQFEAPVTITIPYAVADFPGDPPQPYWYDAMTGAMSQQGITNIQYVALSSTLHALRFQTTHFTPYAVVGEVEEGIVPTGGSGGGGCSLSPAAAGASGALEYFVPFTLLAVAMIGLRIKDKRRHSKPQ